MADILQQSNNKELRNKIAIKYKNLVMSGIKYGSINLSPLNKSVASENYKMSAGSSMFR